MAQVTADEQRRAVAPLLADKVVETDSEGKVFAGKDAVLADAKSITWSSAEYPDLKVTVFGHTAIATGTFTGKGTDAAHKSRDLRDRFTDIRGSRWRTASGNVLPPTPRRSSRKQKTGSALRDPRSALHCCFRES